MAWSQFTAILALRPLSFRIAREVQPFVSVIVPVYNDAVRLIQCLEALESQTYPAERFEVLVVDNGSTEQVDVTSHSYPHVRILHEGRPGSYNARNRGLECARGEILAFTDSDCQPRTDWLELGVKKLSEGCGFIGGHIELFVRDPQRPTAVEQHDIHFGFSQERYVSQGYAATANMMTTRGVMDVVGSFDGAVKSGGDGQWGRRATMLGIPGIHAPEVVVRHPARSTYGELAHKTRRLAGGRHDRRSAGSDTVRSLRSEFFPPIWKLRSLAQDSSKGTLTNRIRLVPVALFVWLIGAAETLRLLAGGTSRR
jgi:glycosyltransferase involved in cell wall biosynthesis